jgi:transcriptional regulator with XRE-family HTH domain
MTKTLVEQYVEDPIHMRLFQQERAIYEVTELIESVMSELGITRSQLATRLGQTRGWVTQLLDGEKNKTIRTIADVLAVMGREYCSFQRPIRVGQNADNSGGLNIVCEPKVYRESRTSASSSRTVDYPLSAVQ